MNDNVLRAAVEICRNGGGKPSWCYAVFAEFEKRNGRKNAENKRPGKCEGVFGRVRCQVENELKRSGLLEKIMTSLKNRGRIVVTAGKHYTVEIVRESDGCYRWSGFFNGWGCSDFHVEDVVIALFMAPRLVPIIEREIEREEKAKRFRR